MTFIHSLLVTIILPNANARRHSYWCLTVMLHHRLKYFGVCSGIFAFFNFFHSCISFCHIIIIIIIIFSIRPPPGLLPVLGSLERYMTPTLDSAVLISSRAGADLGRMYKVHCNLVIFNLNIYWFYVEVDYIFKILHL